MSIGACAFALQVPPWRWAKMFMLQLPCVQQTGKKTGKNKKANSVFIEEPIIQPFPGFLPLGNWK